MHQSASLDQVCLSGPVCSAPTECRFLRFCAYQYQHLPLDALRQRWRQSEQLGFDVLWNCDTVRDAASSRSCCAAVAGAAPPQHDRLQPAHQSGSCCAAVAGAAVLQHDRLQPARQRGADRRSHLPVDRTRALSRRDHVRFLQARSRCTRWVSRASGREGLLCSLRVHKMSPGVSRANCPGGTVFLGVADVRSRVLRGPTQPQPERPNRWKQQPERRPRVRRR